MKQVAIASGKGGTGKTSVTASFAAMARSPVMVDADVDAADLYMLVNPQKVFEADFYGGVVAKLDAELCTRCEACAAVCRYGALVFPEDDDFFVDETACEGCGVCTHVCPLGAIKMNDRLSGKWFISETKYGKLVHARLGIAAENSGKMVTHLRKQAKEIALNDNCELVLIDCPPGIGCPVMAAITGVDLLVCIAEPTVSGKHDLERILELSKHFEIPAVTIINKSDIAIEISREISEHCNCIGAEVITEIPYDKDVIRAIVNRKPLVEFSNCHAAQAIRNAWEKLQLRLSL